MRLSTALQLRRLMYVRFGSRCRFSRHLFVSSRQLSTLKTSRPFKMVLSFSTVSSRTWKHSDRISLFRLGDLRQSKRIPLFEMFVPLKLISVMGEKARSVRNSSMEESIWVQCSKLATSRRGISRIEAKASAENPEQPAHSIDRRFGREIPLKAEVRCIPVQPESDNRCRELCWRSKIDCNERTDKFAQPRRSRFLTILPLTLQRTLSMRISSVSFKRHENGKEMSIQRGDEKTRIWKNLEVLWILSRLFWSKCCKIMIKISGGKSKSIWGQKKEKFKKFQKARKWCLKRI